jgi:hypothetical protein
MICRRSERRLHVTCTVSLRDPEFDTGVLLPGRSYAPLRYERGFFFNDLPFPQDTDKIIVY